mmetsp:Transcript_20957/g.33584  ORF Transcript_20957/g.33584 Transcript_20957/m.33584 type:complete len:136 (+) Transcript_20957:3-410(+)
MDQSLLAVESAAPPQKVEVVLKKAVSDSDSATGQTNEGDEEENATQKAPKQDVEMVEVKATDAEPEPEPQPEPESVPEPEPKVQPSANKGHQVAASSVSNGDLDGVIDVAMDVMSESDGTDAEDETAVAVPGRVP